MSSLPPPETCDFRGQPALRLATPDGSTALLALHGAHLLSWIPAGSPERLFLSDKAVFDGRQAIRGGVPVIFPQFGGEGALRHGFARGLTWRVSDARSGADYATATLRLADDAATRARWPHEFSAEMTVVLSARRLDMELEVTNTGKAEFSFNAALHTYLRIQDVEAVTLRGLQGHQYVDQARANALREEVSEALLVRGEVDRIYLEVGNPLILTHPRGGSIALQQEGFPDVVVWNPGEVKCTALLDMSPEGFRHMLCVEAAAAARAITLGSGESWYGRQTLVELEG